MNSFGNLLTPSTDAANLFALSPHVTVRGESRKNQQMPIKARLIRRLRYSMQVIIYGGRYLGSFGSHGSVAMSLNPDYVHRPIFEKIKRCPLTFNRVHIMTNQSKFAQNSERLPIPKTLDYFFVGVDRQCDGYVIVQCPISPNYRTEEEARSFLDAYRINGAKLIKASFLVDDDEQADRLASDIFGETVA